MKKLLVFLLVLCLCFTFLYIPAYSDGLTATMLGGLSYAVMQSWGMSFNASAGTGSSMQSFMTSQIESFVNERGGSIASLFGSEIARLTAGKLVVGQQLYNGIVNFADWLKSKFGFGEDAKTLANGMVDDMVLPYADYNVSTELKGVGFEVIASSPTSDGYFNTVTIYYDGVQKQKFNGRKWTGAWKITSASSSRIYYALQYNGIFGLDWVNGYIEAGSNYQPINLDWAQSEDYVQPTVLNPDKQWEGTIPSAPDTNLDQLIGQIYDDVADNNLDVTGEVVDVPVPPSPVPTVAPDIPLSDVPWEGLNDLIGSSTDTIGEGIQAQTDAITGAQEATTEAVESLTDTINNALDVPNSEELPDFKFDLRELFPFCIPFDIYRLLSSFDAEPQAPHVRLPIVIQSIGFSYTLDLDFSAWDPVAQAMRTAELIVYAIALAWATGKVIKW